MAFDVAAARKAGYTEAEIADFLAKDSNFDVAAARQHYDDSEIVGFLAKETPKPKSGVPADWLKTGPVRPQPKLNPRFPTLAEETPEDRVRVLMQNARDKDIEEAKRLRREANRPRGARTTPDQTKTEVDDSAAGAFGRASTRGLLPTAAGVLGAEGGAALGAPTAPFTLGIGPLVTGAVGGFGSAYLANKAQQSVLDNLPENFRAKLGQGTEQRLSDAANHPYAVFAGETAPGFLFGRPTRNVMANLGGAGLGALTEGTREWMQSDVDPTLIGEAAVMGALQSKGHGIARSVAGKADNVTEKLIRKYRPEPGDQREHAAAITAIGEQPRPVDVLPGSIVSEVGKDATTGSLTARDLLRKYAEDRVTELPTVARRNVDKIAPQDARTGEEAATQVADEAAQAQERLRPGVVAGDASQAISERLLAERAAEKQHADQLYAEARAKGVATLQRRPPAADEDAGWAKMSPEEEAEFQQSGWLNRKTGEIMPDDQFHDMQRAKGPGPEVAAHLREAISGFAARPDDIKGTLGLLDRADNWSTVDTANLYGLRESLGELERNYAGSPDAAAATQARRALDDFIGRADSEGRFTGDPEVVSANRRAIENWRGFRQRYDDGTLLGRLTQTEWRGAQQAPVMDPQTAGQAILGNLKETGDRVRDLQGLRDRLGADSPEWQALRREAMDRVAGPERDAPNYARKVQDWRAANPKLADLIMGPEGDRALSAARTELADTGARQEAMATGTDFLTREPADFARDTAAMTPRARRDAVVVARQRVRDALTTPEASASMLKDLATNPVAQANLRELLPLPEAIQAVADSQAILRRVKASRAPLEGGGAPDEGERVATDLGRLAGTVHGPVGRALSNAFMDLMRGKGSPSRRRAEATQLAHDLLDPDKAEATMMFVEQMAGQNGVQRLLGVARQGAAERLDALVRLGRVPAAWMAGSDAQKKEPRKLDETKVPDVDPDEVLKSMSDEELDALIGSAGDAGSNGPGNGSSGGPGKNNPGNLRDFPWVKKQPGYIGGSDGFAAFATPEAGVTAHEKLLNERYFDRGYDTPNKIIEKYLGDDLKENPPEVRKNYKAFVADRLGIGINDPIPKSKRADFFKAQRDFETGAGR